MTTTPDRTFWLPMTDEPILLRDAQQELNDGLAKGIHCPCCEQYAKVYRRAIHATMAQVLIQMHRTATIPGLAWRGNVDADGYIHLPTLLMRRHGDEAKLALWGLIEEATEKRADGGRSGWWRVTELGTRFVRQLATVPRYALVYDGRLLGHDGDPVSIVDTLGDRFDYQELMNR